MCVLLQLTETVVRAVVHDAEVIIVHRLSPVYVLYTGSLHAYDRDKTTQPFCDGGHHPRGRCGGVFSHP